LQACGIMVESLKGQNKMKNPIVNEWGVKEWRNAVGQLHRDEGPALEWSDGITKFWYQNGLAHREDGPASIMKCGSGEGEVAQTWWVEGKRID